MKARVPYNTWEDWEDHRQSSDGARLFEYGRACRIHADRQDGAGIGWFPSLQGMGTTSEKPRKGTVILRPVHGFLGEGGESWDRLWVFHGSQTR